MSVNPNQDNVRAALERARALQPLQEDDPAAAAHDQERTQVIPAVAAHEGAGSGESAARTVRQRPAQQRGAHQRAAQQHSAQQHSAAAHPRNPQRQTDSFEGETQAMPPVQGHDGGNGRGAYGSHGGAQGGRVAQSPRGRHGNPGSEDLTQAIVPVAAGPVVGVRAVDAKAETEALKASKHAKKNKEAKPKAKLSRGKKIGLGIGIGVVAVLIVVAVAVVVGIGSINDTLQGDKTDEEMMAIKDSLATTNIDEPFYMLLIGSDTRAEEGTAGGRSDSTILARIDPVNYIITLISIQRDTMTVTEEYGTVKYNACYSYGGAPMAIKYASQLTGVEISHYAEISFTGLEDLVDSVGGIDVEVGETIDDWRVGDFVIESGWQHLDGEKALAFARARYYGLGDYTRASNQRVVIQTLAKKILALPITQLPGTIQAAAKCLSTDMSLYDLYPLAMKFKGQDITFYSANLPSSTATIDGASYVILDEVDSAAMMKIVDAGGDPKSIELQNPDAIIDSNVLANAGDYEDQEEESSESSGN